MRHLLPLGLFFAPLIGCGEDELPSLYAQATLEQAAVVPEEPLVGARRDGSGSLAGELEGPDLELRVATTGGLQVVNAHAPGNPDLTAWLGQDVLLSIATASADGDAALLLRDANDSVLYLLETVEPTSLTTEAFGSNFVDLGNDLGPTAAFRGTMRLYSAMFATDSGTVEVFPGEPQEILVGGLSYRVTLTAAWHRELEAGALLNCNIRTDVLAFEVLLVDPGTANLTPLIRADGVPIEQGECGLPLPTGS